MAKRIVLIQGHPDPAGGHFDHALAEAYERAAREAGHEVKTLTVARLELPVLRSAAEWAAEAPAAVRKAQATLAWAEHWVIVFPLWLGDMPAQLKAFFEQVLRPGFAIPRSTTRGLPKGLLEGRSARIVLTMGMPAFFYRLYYRAHSLKSLKRNVLHFCGIAPVKSTVIGTVEGSKGSREAWLRRLAVLGTRGR